MAAAREEGQEGQEGKWSRESCLGERWACGWFLQKLDFCPRISRIVIAGSVRRNRALGTGFRGHQLVPAKDHARSSIVDCQVMHQVFPLATSFPRVLETLRVFHTRTTRASRPLSDLNLAGQHYRFETNNLRTRVPSRILDAKCIFGPTNLRTGALSLSVSREYVLRACPSALQLSHGPQSHDTVHSISTPQFIYYALGLDGYYARTSVFLAISAFCGLILVFYALNSSQSIS